MSKATDQQRRIQPPYGSFKTFRAFVEKLNKTVLPDAIDRSMMTQMSGVSQAETLVAMRFLGLLGEGDPGGDRPEFLRADHWRLEYQERNRQVAC